MKKISLCLALAMFCAILFVGCNKSNPASDFKYNISEGEICITEYLGKSDTVVIPQEIDDLPVVAIGLNSFMNSEIKSVTIPDSVRLIWDYAFLNCQNLEEVNFGQGLEEISAEAFSNCAKLEKIIFKKGVKTVGPKAFSKCTSVKEIHIPKTLEDCGLASFINNTDLTSIVFEDGVKSIKGDASFYGASSLREITIPASVEKIGDRIFGKCDNLNKVTFLGNAPLEIGFDAFGENKALEIYYPKNASGWDNTALSEKYTLIAN